MTRDRSLLWALLVSFASALAVSIAGVVYTGHSNADRDREWCELLTTLDAAYSSTPPQSRVGTKVAEAIHRLTATFECER
jgi:hypothetical protein